MKNVAVSIISISADGQMCQDLSQEGYDENLVLKYIKLLGCSQCKLNILHLYKNQTANTNGTMIIKTLNVKSPAITESK